MIQDVFADEMAEHGGSSGVCHAKKWGFLSSPTICLFYYKTSAEDFKFHLSFSNADNRGP